MRSHLLEGKVSHLRTRPFTHRLEYSVFYFALDLSELDLVGRSFRLLGRNRRNALEFRDADHWPEPATDEATATDDAPGATGEPAAGG